MTRIPPRIAGTTLPDTHLYWTEDGTYLNLTAYTGWQIEATNNATGVHEWTKTTGITATAGSASVPAVTILWEDDDLGALDPGNYLLELTGTYSGGTRKHQMQITITAEAAAA